MESAFVCDAFQMFQKWSLPVLKRLEALIEGVDVGSMHLEDIVGDSSGSRQFRRVEAVICG
jgi:hypothetical protein